MSTNIPGPPPIMPNFASVNEPVIKPVQPTVNSGRQCRPQRKIPDNAIEFLVKNMKTMTREEMAKALSTPDNELLGRDIGNLINRAISMLRDGAGENGYGLKEKTDLKTGKVKYVFDYENPVTDKAKKIEAWIAEHLRSGNKTRTGTKHVDSNLQSEIDQIISEL